MKHLLSLLFACVISFSIMQAQVPPQAFNYSAVARNPLGQPIANSTIGIQINIIKSSTTGVSQYMENHFVNTDDFGLFNLIVGAGAVQSGSMSSIDWGSDDFYLRVGMDANGGTNFLTMGTTQLMSVPYALHAKTAESILGGGTGGGGFTHYIGEEFGGGVIFHLWKDNAGLEHGLIVDKTDLSTAQIWSNIDQTFIGQAAQSSWDGLSNSNAIISQAGHTNSAAALCLNSTNGGQSDWYLPSIDELERLYNNRLEVNATLRGISGAIELKKFDINGGISYWSSSEVNLYYAWTFNFDNGTTEGNNVGYKGSTRYVRAVRAF
jgi:hypothetical protein